MDEQNSDRDIHILTVANEGLRAQRDELYEQIATLLQRCADLVIARDAWMEVALASGKPLLDATDPGPPTLVSETTAAFPQRALRSRQWTPVV